MQKNYTLKLSDIGYYGKPINALTKNELQIAFLEVAQQLYNCIPPDDRIEALTIENRGKARVGNNDRKTKGQKSPNHR